MGAALVLDRALLEKQIHQHGLAAPDVAVNVEAARRRFVLVGKQPAEQALLAKRLVTGKPLFEIGKGLCDFFLRGVWLYRSRRDESLIMRAERGGRGRQHGLFLRPKPEEIASRELVQALCQATGRARYERGMQCARHIRTKRRRRRLLPASATRSISGTFSGGIGNRLTRSARRNPRPHRRRRRSRRARKTTQSARP